MEKHLAEAEQGLRLVADLHAEGAGELEGYCKTCANEWPCLLRTAAARPPRALAEDWWQQEDPAQQVVWEMIEHAPAACVPFLRVLAEEAPDADRVGLVGAGPLEELLAEHAGTTLRGEAKAAIVDAIDEAARQSREFRTALRSVYFGDEIPADVVARLHKFLEDRDG